MPFRAGCAEVVDAAPLLSELRMIKTPQEIERMRLANELAAIGMEYARNNIQPGMKESEVAAMIEGHIHTVGVGYKGKVEMARAFTLVWSGKGIATFTATSHRPVIENEPTLVEIWVCAERVLDGLDEESLSRTLDAGIQSATRSIAEDFRRCGGLRAGRRSAW